jgi:hypothetical protein
VWTLVLVRLTWNGWKNKQHFLIDSQPHSDRMQP